MSVTTLDSLDKVAAPWRHKDNSHSEDADSSAETEQQSGEVAEELPGESGGF